MEQTDQSSFPGFIVEDGDGEGDYYFTESNANAQSRLLGHAHHHSDFTPQEELIINWTARIAAMFSFVGGLYICYCSWRRRDHVYHRLMLAMSIYILMWSPWLVYGVAAIPAGTPDILGAYGTTATCTAQGFFNQLSMAIPSYYVALSFFSWIVIVHGNFDPSKYAFVEIYIHVGVNLWAIGSSTILAVLNAYNPTEGWPSCYIGSLPMGCGDNTGIECTRGPQNISQILAIFVGLPVFVLLLVPTVTMIALACYLHWKSHHRRRRHPQIDEEGTTANTSSDTSNNATTNHNITVKAVTKQSAVYLGTLFFIYTPGLLMSSAGNFFGMKKNLLLSCFGTAITVSMGLWFAISYWYFSSPSVSGGSGIVGPSNSRRRANNHSKKRRFRILEPRRKMRGSCSNAFSVGENNNNKSDHLSLPASAAVEEEEHEEVSTNSINSIMQDEDESPTEISYSESCTNDLPDNTTNKRDKSQKQASEEFRKSFSFNIFDGTAPSQSQWAEFIFEGDESDEEADLEETRYWAGCQDAG